MVVLRPGHVLDDPARKTGSRPEFLKSVAILGGARRSIAARLASAIHARFSEPSSIVLLALLGLCLAAAWRRADARMHALAGAGLIIGFLVPCVMAFAGKVHALLLMDGLHPHGRLRGGPVPGRAHDPDSQLGCAVTCFARVCRRPAGPACHHVPGVGSQGSRSRRPARRRNIRRTDWVYSEFEAYYPAKKTAGVLFLPPYAGLIPEMEGVTPPIDRPGARAGRSPDPEAVNRREAAPLLWRSLASCRPLHRRSREFSRTESEHASEARSHTT